MSETHSVHSLAGLEIMHCLFDFDLARSCKKTEKTFESCPPPSHATHPRQKVFVSSYSSIYKTKIEFI